MLLKQLLCIIDTRPRDLDDAKIDLHRELGRLAEKEIADNCRVKEGKTLGNSTAAADVIFIRSL